MLFLAQRGYRVIAHDRRGHGRSSQPSSGNDMNTYADDLAAVIDHLDLKNAVLVGHSTGGGEVTRYIGRHGTKRVAKVVLISAIPPLLLKTGANPGEFRQKCGMVYASLSPKILPSSTKTSLFSFMAPTGREPKCRRACSIRSGY
jgi:pimeloyl-ACP methyl ester carboxylesterase